jgi:hypothetical protein
MSLIIPANTLASGGYEVDNSLRFNSGSSDYLNRTMTTPTNNKIYTWSGWIKKTTIGEVAPNIFGAHSGGLRDCIRFDGGGNALQMIFNEAGSGNLVTTQVLRDVSAWYHIVVAVDTTQATSTNRVKIYLNGSQITSFSTSSYPAQNYVNILNAANPHVFGKNADLSNEFFNGYIAETVFIDGTALDPTSFGEFDEDSGIWKPIDVSGLTFGTNGFYLDFEDSAALGDDVSGNGNDFTVNNLTAIDQTTDTPTNNFATLNPLLPNAETFSNGNTTYTNGSNANWRISGTTLAPSVGKYYCEVKITENGGGTQIGVMDMNNLPASLATDIGSGSWSWSYDSASGNARHDGGSTAWGNTFTTDDVMGIAMDLDNLKLYFAKNGTWQDSGDPTSGATGTGSAFDLDAGGAYAFAITSNDDGTDPVQDCNFGNPAFTISSGNTDGNGYGNFEYAVPSGYLSLCTANLSEVLG